MNKRIQILDCTLRDGGLGLEDAEKNRLSSVRFEKEDMQEIADNLKKYGSAIPGIKPGKNTAEYIDAIMSRITLPGSIFLAIVAIMPAFAGLFGVQAEFAQFFGGTSLLILVGVVLDTLQQVESHLLMRHYDGLLSSGRIKGRNVAAY